MKRLRTIILSAEASTVDGRLAFVADGESLEAIGARLAEGAILTVWRYAVIGFVGLLIVGLLLQGLMPKDSTDASRWVRSGLRLRTDASTGCQYLETSDGAVTPRLTADGRPMCGSAL